MLLNRSFPRSFAFREVPRCVVYHPILPSVRIFQSNSKIYRFLRHFLINLKIYFFFELHLEIFPGPQNHQKHAQSTDLSKYLRFKKISTKNSFQIYFYDHPKKFNFFFGYLVYTGNSPLKASTWAMYIIFRVRGTPFGHQNRMDKQLIQVVLEVVHRSMETLHFALKIKHFLEGAP